MLYLQYKSIDILVAVALNTNKSTSEYVKNIYNNVFKSSSIDQLQETVNDCSVKTLYDYAAFAELAVSKEYWSFLRKHLYKNEQKLVFLKKCRKGCNAIMCSFANQDISTIAFVINTAKNLLKPCDFLNALYAKDHVWLIETLCHYAAHVESKVFKMFWNLIESNLEKNEQKLVFLRNNQKRQTKTSLQPK